MKKQDAIYGILLGVNGHKDSQDQNIEYLDVENYFHSALASAIENEFKARYVASERLDMERYTIDADFLKSVTLAVVGDCDRYADFPVNIMTLPGDNGVRGLFTKDYGAQIVRSKSAAGIIGLDSLPVALFWLGKSPAGADRVFLKNLSSDITELVADVVYAPESYLDEDELAVPGVCLDAAILQATNYFMRSKLVPVDEVTDLVEDGKKQ
jgi:hypothetical protein